MRQLPQGTRVLELGPGAAHVARLTGRADLRWQGIENSIDCLPALSGTLAGGAIVDLEALPRLPRGYGAVLAADTLEHLNDPERMLRLIHEALPAGAPLVLSVPNVANVHVRLSLLFGRFQYTDRGILDRTHRVFFTRQTLRGMLEKAGFRIEREAVSTIPLPLALPKAPEAVLEPLTRGLEAATRVLPRLLGYQLLALARRT